MQYTSTQGFSAPHRYFLVWLGASTINNCTVIASWEVLSESLSLPGLGCRFLASIGELELCHQGIYSLCVRVRTCTSMYICGVCASVGIIFMIPPKDNAQHIIVVTRNGYNCHLVMFCGQWFSIMFWLIGGTFIFIELHLYGEQHISVIHYCVGSVIHHWYTTVWLATYISGTLLLSQSQQLLVWYFL